MTNMNYGHLTLFDDALNEWLQKMNNYCEMRAAYKQGGGIIFQLAIMKNFVCYFFFHLHPIVLLRGMIYL